MASIDQACRVDAEFSISKQLSATQKDFEIMFLASLGPWYGPGPKVGV